MLSEGTHFEKLRVVRYGEIPIIRIVQTVVSAYSPLVLFARNQMLT